MKDEATTPDAEAKARLDARLRRLTYDDMVDWMNERYAERAWNYRENVRDVYAAADGYVATVQGAELYAVKVTADSYGEFVSTCSCPIGGNCKHAGALAFVVAERLRNGETVGEPVPEELLKKLPVRREAPPPPEPPPRPRVVVPVEENPFGRFTRTGGRHAKSYSFRVAAGGRVFHWDFILSTLVYSLAKRGCAFEEGASWWSEPDRADPPLFTCSCGDVHCGGFGGQRATFTEEDVRWEVESGAETIEFVFARLQYEAWVVETLWRMRGSARLRNDPWGYLQELSDFQMAVDELLAARPRCRALWRVLKEKGRFAPEDLDACAAVRAGDAEAVDLRAFSGTAFSTASGTDLRQAHPLDAERGRVREQLKDARVGRCRRFVYLPVYAPNWQTTEMRRGDRLAFVREVEDGHPSVRVESLTRGVTVGRLKREDARWVTAMMDRHGLVLKGRLEPERRSGKGLLVRFDVSFARKGEWTFGWGGSLAPTERLYFEMIRSLVCRMREYPVAVVQEETERLKSVLLPVLNCPEVAFLFALVTAAAREAEARLLDATVARRLARCARVRRAMSCRPAGALLAYRDLQVLPLVAPEAVAPEDPRKFEDVERSLLPLSWREAEARVPEGFPRLPDGATGFAVFRKGALLDLCLTGVPLVRTGLSDKLALYAKDGDGAGRLSLPQALARLAAFLDFLPVRAPEGNLREVLYWHEAEIKCGLCELDEEDRLVVLRFLMKDPGAGA